jgi:hypothetical protein
MKFDREDMIDAFLAGFNRGLDNRHSSLGDRLNMFDDWMKEQGNE